MALWAKSDSTEWNAYLTRARDTGDVQGLADTLRRLEIGMDNLVQQKLNVEKMNVFFLRLQRSIENTLKEIYRRKNANPLWNAKDKTLHEKFLKDKQQKNHELEAFLRKVRY